MKLIIWQAGISATDWPLGHLRITRPLLDPLPDETEDAWLDRVAADALAKDATLAGFTRLGNVDETALPADRTHRQYWRSNAGAIAADQSLVDAGAIADNLALRAAAKLLFSAIDAQGKRDRAIVLTIKDELNLLRDWITQFMAQVGAATSLADLKTRVAALPAMPQRTAAQAKTAILNKLDTSEAD